MIRALMILIPLVLPGLYGKDLSYFPAPVENPLKGLVPYAAELGKDRFPHSMEFRYLALRDLMRGPEQFDWGSLERQLEDARARGNQSIVRIFLEYPGKNGIPGFLEEKGLKVIVWNEGGKEVRTPDYEDPRLREALKRFIAAFGARYDGDPRLGFITAGILGLWGEWHTYPKSELMASKTVQTEVMEAYEQAFQKTFVLLRYPAGKDDAVYADNSKGRFGYHDDSFAWATLDNGKEEDSWFFLPKLKKAGVQDKWKRVPIGGEIRPEIWGTTFTNQVTGQQEDFGKCVRESHVSWLMDTGAFSDRFPMDQARRQRALAEVGKMGYELHLAEASIDGGELVLKVENRGVAPFYYDWPVEIRAGKVWKTNWKLSEVLPGKPVEWRLPIGDSKTVAIRVSNPMKGGKPLRFANAGYREGWLPLLTEVEEQ